MRETLRRGQRLTPSSLFRETMDQGQVFRGKHFVLFCQTPDSGEAARAGVFAGRRLGKAVERNRAKRRVREAYRRIAYRVEEDGLRFVFQARREAVRAPFQEILAEMELLITRARALSRREQKTSGNA